MNQNTERESQGSRRKVLHIASGDLWAGAEAQVFQLVCAHMKGGHITAAVILLNHGELARRLISADVEVFILPEAELHPASLLLQTLSIARNWRPDAIHTHRFKENVLGCLAAMLLGVPLVRTQHGLPEHTSQATLRSRLANRFDRLAARLYRCTIVSVSLPTLQYARRTFPTARHLLIANGVQNDLLPSLAPRKQSAVKRVGLCGRLVAVKRADIFLEMARRLLDRGNGKWQFLIIGDGPLMRPLQRLAEELNLSEKCQFIGHRSDVMLELFNLDVLAITSDHEGLPMVALEALAVGTPVVARAVGGLPQLLSRREAGFVLESADPEELAIAIEQQLALGHLADSQARKSLLPADYDIIVTASSYEAAYSGFSNDHARVQA